MSFGIFGCNCTSLDLYSKKRGKNCGESKRVRNSTVESGGNCIAFGPLPAFQWVHKWVHLNFLPVRFSFCFNALISNKNERDNT